MENKREFGDELEDDIIDKAEDLGVKITGTWNSGAGNRIDSDLSHERFQIECKRTASVNARGKNYPKLKYVDWIKLKKEANVRSKTPALVIGSKELKDTLVVLELSAFLNLVAGSEEE